LGPLRRLAMPQDALTSLGRLFVAYFSTAPAPRLELRRSPGRLSSFMLLFALIDI
jgi:hypothetical protein